jgi:predicted kinase
MKKLILLRGIPGSGKSTFAKSISNESTGHIESDMFFVKDGEYKFDGSRIKDAHNWCQDVVEHWMNSNEFETIIVSNTFTQEWEMKPYMDMAKEWEYQVFSIIVENRHGGVNQHGVPDEKLQQMNDRFEIKIK